MRKKPKAITAHEGCHSLGRALAPVPRLLATGPALEGASGAEAAAGLPSGKEEGRSAPEPLPTVPPGCRGAARQYLSSRRGWATASFRQAMLASATRFSEDRESLVSARRVIKR